MKSWWCNGACSSPIEKQSQRAKQAREARHIGWSGGPPPGKFLILDLLRSFLVQSWDETARYSTTASQTEPIIGPAAAARAAPTPTAGWPCVNFWHAAILHEIVSTYVTIVSTLLVNDVEVVPAGLLPAYLTRVQRSRMRIKTKRQTACRNEATCATYMQPWPALFPGRLLPLRAPTKNTFFTGRKGRIGASVLHQWGLGMISLYTVVPTISPLPVYYLSCGCLRTNLDIFCTVCKTMGFVLTS